VSTYLFCCISVFNNNSLTQGYALECDLVIHFNITISHTAFTVFKILDAIAARIQQTNER